MRDFNLVVSDEDFARLMAIQPPSDLRAELERAIIVSKDSIKPDIVTMNSRVRYRDMVTNACREVEIVFPEEADPSSGKVSVFAPVGAALIGLSIGHEIEWDFPNGESHQLVVEAVEHPAPSSDQQTDN